MKSRLCKNRPYDHKLRIFLSLKWHSKSLELYLTYCFDELQKWWNLQPLACMQSWRLYTSGKVSNLSNGPGNLTSYNQSTVRGHVTHPLLNTWRHVGLLTVTFAFQFLHLLGDGHQDGQHHGGGSRITDPHGQEPGGQHQAQHQAETTQTTHDKCQHTLDWITNKTTRCPT